MRYGKLKAGLAVAGMLVGVAGMAIQPAFADYAPTNKDVVGVGSDTLQYLVDFVADGDPQGDFGYNSAGNKNKLINFDATADANARLAYAANGVGSGQCAPGTGGTAGTGNGTSTHADSPCTLNPTIVLRAGLSPVERPNGSGAGAKALAGDTSVAGTGQHVITFARASSCQGPTTGCGGNLSAAFDSIQVGIDPLGMLKASVGSNVQPLTAAQLNLVYSCNASANNWSQFGGPAGTIIPIIPQVGSGTRSSFLSAIGNPTLGPCVVTAEENDPTAIAAQSSPANAVEPMSGGRLNLFQGLLSDGTANGTGPYFNDPSCALNNINASTPAACSNTGNANKINPAVAFVTGTPTGGGTLFSIQRPLYIYFRDADVNSTTAFQPGGTLNAIRTLFYNPCIGTGCTGFGPGGPPWFDQAPAQADISAAGIVPAYVPQVGGP